jgi:uncharacterized protein YciI
MKHFLLFYDYVPDYLEKRPPLRPAHLELARASVARDELQLGGAVPDGDPPFGLLFFKSESAVVAEEFARKDPYVTQGVVAAWRVKEWVTVVGERALTQV